MIRSSSPLCLIIFQESTDAGVTEEVDGDAGPSSYTPPQSKLDERLQVRGKEGGEGVGGSTSIWMNLVGGTLAVLRHLTSDVYSFEGRKTVCPEKTTLLCLLERPQSCVCPYDLAV